MDDYTDENDPALIRWRMKYGDLKPDANEIPDLKTADELASEGWGKFGKAVLSDTAPIGDEIQPAFDMFDFIPMEKVAAIGAGASKAMAAKLAAASSSPKSMAIIAAIRSRNPEIKTMKDVLEYIKKHNPLYHSSSASNIRKIHSSGLEPSLMGDGGAIENSYLRSDPENYDYLKDNSLNPVSFMAETPTPFYGLVALNKGDKYGNIEDIPSNVAQKNLGVSIIPRDESINRYGKRDKSVRGIGDDVRKWFNSLDEGKELVDFDDRDLPRLFIENGDYVSAEHIYPEISLTGKDAIELMNNIDGEHTSMWLDKLKKAK